MLNYSSVSEQESPKTIEQMSIKFVGWVELQQEMRCGVCMFNKLIYCLNSPSGSVVCQPRRKQQHAEPDPQLRAEDPVPAGSHHATNHGHVPTGR